MLWVDWMTRLLDAQEAPVELAAEEETAPVEPREPEAAAGEPDSISLG